jgi:hypothetical protein
MPTLSALVFAAVFSAIGAAHEPGTDQGVASQMARAAEQFVRSLDEEQLGQTVYKFDSEKRHAWHYFPSAMLKSRGGRPGLAIEDMQPEQRVLAHGLVASALSHRGHLTAMTIVMLQAILHDLEKNPAYNPEMYHVAVYGEPSTENSWAWCFEGHHLSIRVTLVDGNLFSLTPTFFGANPARVKSGPLKGVEPLKTEQELARKLVQSLTPEQRKLAVIAEAAPKDIVTGSQREVETDRFQPAQGIPFEKLDKKQQGMLLDLVAAFTSRYRQEIVDQVDRRTPIAEGPGMHFAWAGSFKPGEGHYWRIQTPHFLFEYDNTQNDANHIHTVWRQFNGDFGEDLLRRHYATAPEGHGHDH